MPSGVYKHQGHKCSEETRIKISEANKEKNKGKKKPPRTKEHRKRLSESHKGHKVSEETRRKISENNKGKGHSEEWRKKVSKAERGKKHFNWKGGITPENDRIRHSIEWRLWREAVFARDNWTCQKCREKGRKLNPHHIKSFAEYPELRFAINNGITFCKKCHMKFHKRYGIKDNDEEQLKEFLREY